MNSLIDMPTEEDYEEITDVWETSIRATHHFIQEKDIVLFKTLVLHQYLKMLDLFCIRDKNRHIVGFIGVAENKIEMLFIHPASRGMGVGKQLLQYAINTCHAKQVDVNEQNEQAIGFYKKFGFEVIGRSETDSLGKPYPLLHMELKQT